MSGKTLGLLILAATAVGGARAEPSELADKEVIVVSPVARDLDEPAFATVIQVDDRRAETATVAEVLSESVGARVRSLGGLGAFSSISVRGAAAGNTTVLVDGVPLSRLASVVVDLGRFELATFDRVELYRGGAPVRYGAATLGGTVNLRTRVDPGPDGQRVRLAIGGGSFGARHALASYTTALGSAALMVLGSYRAADGNFRYWSDNGTNLNPDDDGEMRRQNNDFEQVDVVARLAGGDRLAVGSRLLFKSQGIPGFGTVQTESTRYSVLSELIDATFSRPLAAGMLSTTGFGYLERARYQDLDNEVGLGAQNRSYLTLAAGLSAAYVQALGDEHRLEVAADGRFDSFDERDVDMDDGRETRGLRQAVGLTAATDLQLGEAVLVRPSVRLDGVFTQPTVDSNAALGAEAVSREDLFASPRLAARWRLSSNLAVKSNAGLFFRAPTLVELFGDRGYLVGNPALDPERGLSGDAGVVWSHPEPVGRVDRIMVEAVGFGTRAQQVIAFTSNAGGFTAAQNLGAASTAGAELSASVRLASRFTVSGNYTYLWTRRSDMDGAGDGRQIPQRPSHQLYGRGDLALSALGRSAQLWVDSTFTSRAYLDAANRSEIPRRLFVGAGLKLGVTEGVFAGFEVKNLFDQRVEDIELSPAPSPQLTSVRRAIADYFGYPLPGRALYMNLEMTL